MPIEHDGAQYWSQAEIDDMIKGRLRSQGAELAAAKKDLEAARKASDEADKHQTRIGELEQELAQVQSGIARRRAAGALGIQDDDTVWALEKAHERAMSSVEEAQRVEFGDYLKSLKEDPSLAPTYLRGVFQGAEQIAKPAAPAKPDKAPAKPAAPEQPARPAWASATAGQLPVRTGAQTSFADRARAAKSLDELAALQQERRGA
jgi:hypothetical protein